MKNATEGQLTDETMETNSEEEVNQDTSKTAPLFDFGSNITRDDKSVSTFGTHRQGDENNSQNENHSESQKSASTLSTLSTMDSKTPLSPA